ncbi:MAG: UDP-N-acetylglucosamine 4,6-dehydratase [Capnocytophaga sp.]|nr:UDP-N-acetylglucosamine 4,6-dehydratase [Capnocytophaga sp.]
MLNINQFIEKNVINRSQSMFAVDLDNNKAKLSSEIKDKTVLVIGGAGSIGSSFIKALLSFEPQKLVVVDINENGLAELTRDLRSTSGMFIPQQYITYPMSYADDTFKKMFVANQGFDIVANFSAHKHVRSEKDKFSVEALLKNNVINAKILLDLLEKYPPKHFFCVSTDKAANPVNIMGGSKKIMEDMIMSYADKFPVTTARFANVAFSNGSLPAGFLERVAKKQPISAPSDVTRYFVSPEESGQICLMACVLGKTGQIYFPKLKKEQVMTFAEIAELLLKELGYEADYSANEQEALQKAQIFQENQAKYPVYFSQSDTTGEKPYEEFFTESESVNMGLYNALGVIDLQEFKTKKEVETLINSLLHLFEDTKTEKADIVRVMKNFLVNFDHQETGKYLDSKM